MRQQEGGRGAARRTQHGIAPGPFGGGGRHARVRWAVRTATGPAGSASAWSAETAGALSLRDDDPLAAARLLQRRLRGRLVGGRAVGNGRAAGLRDQQPRHRAPQGRKAGRRHGQYGQRRQKNGAQPAVGSGGPHASSVQGQGAVKAAPSGRDAGSQPGGRLSLSARGCGRRRAGRAARPAGHAAASSRFCLSAILARHLVAHLRQHLGDRGVDLRHRADLHVARVGVAAFRIASATSLGSMGSIGSFGSLAM